MTLETSHSETSQTYPRKILVDEEGVININQSVMHFKKSTVPGNKQTVFKDGVGLASKRLLEPCLTLFQGISVFKGVDKKDAICCFEYDKYFICGSISMLLHCVSQIHPHSSFIWQLEGKDWH